MLHEAISRWQIERAFQDDESALGLDHLEYRRHAALRRQLSLTAISDLFLAATRQQLLQAPTSASTKAGTEEKET